MQVSRYLSLPVVGVLFVVAVFTGFGFLGGYYYRYKNCSDDIDREVVDSSFLYRGDSLVADTIAVR